MDIIVGFLPFIGFAIVDRLSGAFEALVTGAVISALLLYRDWKIGKLPKVLELGTLVLFTGLAGYSILMSPSWSIWVVRLLVDAGLLAIVLISMAIGLPFTLQYARETVDPRFWGTPQFRRTNYIITAVWALAFMVMVGADLLLLYVPHVSPRLGILLTIVALVIAIKFTNTYPKRLKARAAEQG